ncbi:arsenic resistance N-acetyltransferase ArsN2 [Lysobacter auxotrophicus]|uniref:Arsenic resistance N-acetyltransferase ArsN2 n=1 Tax=Lysobacter auxotrophicus TaxID=2992573 RepID=A0ABM8DHP7_9GAMM|nr:arsenic resistance N-acetyltransferase ArsN2 [Lysobacter auxotrophicus]BDU18124.1 arsenic resistance N-acetyltransferase ArsN2 [Lysobacter auxotrophicus]
MNLRLQLPHEREGARSLLDRAALPVEDLDTADVRFIVAIENDELVGVVGLQQFGSAGLLRSLAVRQDFRGSGVGGRLVDALESLAREGGLDQLVLLTQTAAPFFAARGYRAIERADAPASVHDSAEFRSLCPATASCMSKQLDDDR